MSRARHKPRNTDLPDAIHHLHDAINELTYPQTMCIGRTKHHAPSLYMQLWDATAGQQGTGHGGIARSLPAAWIDAIDQLQEIDLAVAVWQPAYTGVPTTVARLRQISARTWRPQDIKEIERITKSVQRWTRKITELLDPQSVKYLYNEDHVYTACPACGATSIKRLDNAGDLVNQPALQIITNQGCTCVVCKTCWSPQFYQHLARVIGCDLPEGVLQ